MTKQKNPGVKQYVAKTSFNNDLEWWGGKGLYEPEQNDHAFAYHDIQRDGKRWKSQSPKKWSPWYNFLYHCI